MPDVPALLEAVKRSLLPERAGDPPRSPALEADAPAPGPASSTPLAELERRCAVAVLSAELAHELASTRLFLRDLSLLPELEATDREIAAEETARLERLIGSLRRAREGEPVREETSVLAALERALSDLKAPGGRTLEVELRVPPQAWMR